MQSQQKRVKWSRGETAEALEERADTGITQASVELMENCIPDIYGNISRRPALKPIPLLAGYNDGETSPYLGFVYDKGIQFAVFYITEDDIILVGIHTHAAPEFLRIKNGKVVSKKIFTSTICYSGVYENNIWVPKVISYAQQNNYMIIGTASNTWKLEFPTINDITFTPSVELWKFSGGWYAPNGTKTKTATEIVFVDSGTTYHRQLHIRAGSLTPYSYTDSSGITTQYSAIQLGNWGGASVGREQIEATKEAIPLGSIVQMPNSGAYMRVEGYFVNYNPFPDITFDGVVDIGGSVPATGKYCKNETGGQMRAYIDGSIVSVVTIGFNGYIKIVVKNTASATLYSSTIWNGGSPTPSLLAWTDAIGGAYSAGTGVWAFGSFLTPIADDTAIDALVNVEYGYESLMPSDWSAESTFPHPIKIMFANQRLWAGGWAFSLSQQYSLVMGSQIARYNDLKNDYNQENEAITLDILTNFKERIIHLVDYNGLKIFTDSFEYIYDTDGVVKQSSNGAYENCAPLVFESLCLYVDSTGNQIKAMQYEFQSNIFNSSSINQLAPHDLVWFPYCMAAFEDKIYSTGKYLFLINKAETNIPRIAVCNFVPSNQANIWNRWSVPNVTLNSLSGGATVPLVDCVIHTKKQPIFMLALFQNLKTYGSSLLDSILYPAILDFEGSGDLTCEPLADNRYAVINYVQDPGLSIEQDYFLTIPGATVAIYSNGEFQFNTTLDSNGYITADISQLTNVTVGLPINSTIRSHPIDVGGKTKSIKKRIAKARMSVRDTKPGAITINGKTGYMNPAQDYISFYGITGMKQEIKYTITNNNGAMFHLESLLMNIEYGTLIS